MNQETWKCPRCRQEIEVQFDECWSCGALRAGLVGYSPEYSEDAKEATQACCPQCKSYRTIPGIVKQPEISIRRTRFVPDAAAGQFFWVSTPAIAVPGRACVCLDCGLLWSSVDPDEANRKFEKFIHDTDAHPPGESPDR